jgi:hypothetical protein
VRQAHVYEIVLAEAFAEVHEQRRQAGRDLPVQQALYDLVGLAQPLGERGEQPEGEPGVALYDALQGGFLDARDPGLGHGLGEHVLPATLDQIELAEDTAVLEEGRGGLLVVAVDLVQSHRAGEEEVELVVGVAGGEYRVLRLEPALDHSEAGLLKIVEVEPFRRAGGGETPGVVACKHLTRLPL